jgi:hypothetical protein
VTSASPTSHDSGHQHRQRAEPVLEEPTVTPASPISHNPSCPDHQYAEPVPFASPPASPPHVVPPTTLDAIAAKVKRVADGVEETCIIKGVTPTLFEEFDSWAAGNLPGWESVR